MGHIGQNPDGSHGSESNYIDPSSALVYTHEILNAHKHAHIHTAVYFMHIYAYTNALTYIHLICTQTNIQTMTFNLTVSDSLHAARMNSLLLVALDDTQITKIGYAKIIYP